MDKKSAPVIVGNAGHGITISVFENKGEKGNFHTASINRPYEDKKSGETKWQRVSIPVDDLLLVADEAIEVFRQFKRKRRKE